MRPDPSTVVAATRSRVRRRQLVEQLKRLRLDRFGHVEFKLFSPKQSVLDALDLTAEFGAEMARAEAAEVEGGQDPADSPTDAGVDEPGGVDGEGRREGRDHRAAQTPYLHPILSRLQPS